MKHETGWAFGCSLGPSISTACNKLILVERANNLLSSSEIHFLVKDAKVGDTSLNEITDAFIKQKDEPFQLWLSNGSGSKTKVWNHVVARLHLSYSQNDSFDPKLVVTTVEQLAHLNRYTKNRAHSKHEKRVSTLVESLIKENELTADSIEQTKEVQEFGLLRQCYMTDYQFIMSHLIPRSSGDSGSGFRLFTKDGKKVCFQTLSYKAKDCTMEPEFVLKIDEFIDCYEVLKKGGIDIKSGALSPIDKRVVYSDSKGEDGNTGSTGPSWSYPTYLQYPVYSKDALEAITKSHQRGISGNAYPLWIRLIGSDKIGKERMTPEFPMKIKFGAGTKYRKRDDQNGYLEEIVHHYDSGTYEMTLKCSRGKINV